MLFGGAFHESYLIPVFRGIFFLENVCEFVLDTVSGSTFFCEVFSGDSDESLLSVSHTVYINLCDYLDLHHVWYIHVCYCCY